MKKGKQIIYYNCDCDRCFWLLAVKSAQNVLQRTATNQCFLPNWSEPKHYLPGQDGIIQAKITNHNPVHVYPGNTG